MAGHKKGSAMAGSKYDNWCCQYGTHAPKAVSICKQQNGKNNGTVAAKGSQESVKDNLARFDSLPVPL